MMLHNAMTLAGSTSLSPIGPDVDLIATCAAFSDLERASDVVTNKFKGDPVKRGAGEAQLATIVAEQDVLVERMMGLPCTTLAGVQAMAKALVAWDRELLKDGAAKDVGEVITSNLVERLLALRHPDADLLSNAARMIGGPLPVLDADVLALRPKFDRLHALMIDSNKDLVPDGGTECADFDGLCDRIASADPAATAEGRAFQAMAAMHHLTYRLSDCEQARNPAWLMLKGIAGDAFQSVEART